MTRGRASVGLLSTLSAGGDAALGVSTTTGTRQGAGPLVGLSTRLAAPVEQLLRRQAMAARDVADQRAILKALRDDRRLLRRPRTSSFCAGSPAHPIRQRSGVRRQDRAGLDRSRRHQDSLH
jgi:hypothetical protein